MKELEEAPAAAAAEAPMRDPQEFLCGIGGCRTRYGDLAIMARHKLNEHGVGAAQNRNQPQSLNTNIKLA